VFLIPSIKYYMLQVGAHQNASMLDNPLTTIAVASLTNIIKCLLEAGVDANIIAGGALIRNSLDCSLGSKMVHGIERKCHLRCVELIIFLLQNLDMSISVVILYSINRKVMQQLYLPCVLYHAQVCN
jgi:hypothetical protein